MRRNEAALVSGIVQVAHEITGVAVDYNSLLHMVGDAQIVLLGEASHGTREFYRERAAITRRLITERGFNAVAIEGDWPDAYRTNQYVKGREDISAIQALDGFKRFPSWMWANREVLQFISWLHGYNETQDEDAKAGFYGLDLYSMHASMAAVISYLHKIDPEAAARARERYACLDHFGINPQSYSYAASYGGLGTCEEEVIRQLLELHASAETYLSQNGRLAEDAYFYAAQNAKLVKNAEEYYRLMFSRSVSTWNLRDRHMAETLEALIDHLNRTSNSAKVVVWAHNSHVGDARATEMSKRGELNIGQLLRERYGGSVVNVGFTTHNGTVTAASDWDEPGQKRRVRDALPGSYERLFHDTGLPAFLLRFDQHPTLAEQLSEPRLERAIGVVYRPMTERVSHYFLASLPHQFDAILHFDETEALEPLDLVEHWQVDEQPETYPFGI